MAERGGGNGRGNTHFSLTQLSSMPCRRRSQRRMRKNWTPCSEMESLVISQPVARPQQTSQPVARAQETLQSLRRKKETPQSIVRFQKTPRSMVTESQDDFQVSSETPEDL